MCRLLGVFLQIGISAGQLRLFQFEYLDRCAYLSLRKLVELGSKTARVFIVKVRFQWNSTREMNPTFTRQVRNAQKEPIYVGFYRLMVKVTFRYG